MRTDKKVQVILYRNPKEPEFLMLLTNQGEKSFWQGVTGGVESTDISIKEAAIREVSEETGVVLVESQLIGPLHQYRFKTSHPDHFDQEVEEYCFIAELLEVDKITISDEHQKFEWLDFGRTKTTIAHDNPKVFLQKIKDYLNDQNHQPTKK